MVVRVTILALATLRIERDSRIARIAVVLPAGVALLAQTWPRYLQQEVVVGAVRIVAVQAALGHRRVLPQERSALLRMTLEASLIDGRCLKHRFCVAAVRVMTIRAHHFALTHWHM